MPQFMFISHDIDVYQTVKAEHSCPKQEEHKWFYVLVSNAVVRPGAVMVHLVDTSPTLAAIMYRFDLDTAGFLAHV